MLTTHTNVLTVFQILEENSRVRYETEGKVYRYYPTVSRGEAGDAAVECVFRNRMFPEAHSSSPISPPE